ncbi:hypothetical protein OF83DRAFT_1295511 [Amylostereum chailletii]|nr:hypothetical protein OF83DRAFT_1295511 [Amylostereum chailletii]
MGFTFSASATIPYPAASLVVACILLRRLSTALLSPSTPESSSPTSPTSHISPSTPSDPISGYDVKTGVAGYRTLSTVKSKSPRFAPASSRTYSRAPSFLLQALPPPPPTRRHVSITFSALYLLQRLKARFPSAKFALREINQMDREMCSYLEWQLNVEPTVLRKFETHVRRDFYSVGPYPPLLLPTPASDPSPSNPMFFGASMPSSASSASSASSSPTPESSRSTSILPASSISPPTPPDTTPGYDVKIVGKSSFPSTPPLIPLPPLVTNVLNGALQHLPLPRHALKLCHRIQRRFSGASTPLWPQTIQRRATHLHPRCRLPLHVPRPTMRTGRRGMRPHAQPQDLRSYGYEHGDAILACAVKKQFPSRAATHAHSKGKAGKDMFAFATRTVW